MFASQTCTAYENKESKSETL